jgi:hypothetical protein
MDKSTKGITVKEYIKTTKPILSSELFVKRKYKNYSIRGRGYKAYFPYNPTLYNAEFDSTALFDMEIYALTSDAYLQGTARLSKNQGFAFTGKAPSQFIRNMVKECLILSKPKMDLQMHRIEASLKNDLPQITLDKIVELMPRVNKALLPRFYNYLIENLFETFYINLNDIDFNENKYLADSIKCRKPAILFSLDFYPTGSINKAGKKSSKYVEFYMALACCFTNYAKEHIDGRYENTLSTFNKIYDDWTINVGPFPTSKDEFLKKLEYIAKIAFEWIKSKKATSELIDLFNSDPFGAENVESCPIAYFCFSILEDLFSDITDKIDIRQCSYCKRFFLSTNEIEFCSKKCKTSFYNHIFYKKNRDAILPKARIRSERSRKALAEEIAQKQKRAKLKDYFKSLNIPSDTFYT